MTQAKREDDIDEYYLDRVEEDLGTRDLAEANRRTRVKWEWEMEADE